jgi:hypothetical protein
MFNVEPRDSDEPQYEYDEPKKPLTPRQLANYALVATSAVASVAFGLQIVGPAVASAMYPSSTQVTPAISSPGAPTSSASPAGYPESAYSSASTNSQESFAANLGVTPASLAGVTAVGVTPSAAATQIQLPSGAPSFGNLSSATPSGGSMAAWGSGSGEDDEDDDRDDDEDDDEDDD